MDYKKHFTSFKKLFLFSLLPIIFMFSGCDLDSPNDSGNPLSGTVNIPIFSLSSGTVDSGTQVTISTDTANATIWYSTGDGSQADPLPDQSVSGVTGSSEVMITIIEDQTIKAIACAENMNNSRTGEVSFIVTFILAADGVNNRIIGTEDMTGTNAVPFGTLGAGVNQFNPPSDLCADSEGRIYIVDSFNSRIVRIDDITGAGWTSFGIDGLGVNEFMNPQGICIDSQDRIYVADFDNSRIVRFDDMNGTNWISYTVDWPNRVAVDSEDRIYFNDVFSNRIGRCDKQQNRAD